MAETLFGVFSVGASVPGISAQLEAVADALEDLRDAVQLQVGLLTGHLVTLNTQISAIGTASAAIRIPAVADFQVQLDASIGIQAGFSAQLGDPAAYLAGLQAALGQVTLNVGALVPSVALNAQIAAAAGTEALMGAKIGAIDVELSALATISASLSGVFSAIGAIQAAINVALGAVLSALSAYVSFAGSLGSGGAACILYDGTLAGLGAGIDAVTVGIPGMTGATNVRVPVVIVATSNAPGLAAVNATFRVS